MTTRGSVNAQDRYAGLLACAASLTSEELLDVVEDAQREIDAAHARQAVALAHLSAVEPVRQEDGTSVEVHRGLGHQRLDAPELAASRLGVSVHVATTRVEDAVRQLTRTPALVDAMAAGDLDLRRAAVVTDETEFLSGEAAATVVAALAPHWVGVTVGPLRRLAARTVARLFPETVAAEAERVRERRSLTRVTGEHGVDTWRGEVLVEQSRPAWVAVTELARRLVREGHADSLAQGRSDAMMRLVLEHSDVKVVVHTTRAADVGDSRAVPGASRGRTSSPGPHAANEGGVEVGGFGAPGTALVPAHSLGSADGSLRAAEVGGLGAPGTALVPAHSLGSADGSLRAAEVGGFRGAGARSAGRDRTQATLHADAVAHEGRSVGAEESGLVCDSETGGLVGGHVPAGLAPGRDLTRPRAHVGTGVDLAATGATDGSGAPACATYRIPAAMVRFVRLRDGSCRFPGCSTPARQCDLDHVRPWPTGPTATTNLICLCRRHHRIKQRDGWSVRLQPDATVTWTDPTGRTTTTMPVDHLHLAATIRTASPDPAAPAPSVGPTMPASTLAPTMSTSPLGRAAHWSRIGAPAPRRHVDLSLLDDDLSQLLTDHHARDTRRRHHRRGHSRHLTFDAHELTDGTPIQRPDWVWPQLAYEPPSPPEPRPDVIPF